MKTRLHHILLLFLLGAGASSQTFAASLTGSIVDADTGKPPKPHRPRALGGTGAEGMKKEILSSQSVRPGVVGAADELGLSAVEMPHPIRDLHVTLLHLLGLEDNKLTYLHGGSLKQLSQFDGQLIPEIFT